MSVFNLIDTAVNTSIKKLPSDDDVIRREIFDYEQAKNEFDITLKLPI
jgi:hypothetical protein